MTCCTRCDCDQCLGYARPLDPAARRGAQHRVPPIRKTKRADARRWLLNDLEMAPDERPTYPRPAACNQGPRPKHWVRLDAMSTAELDEIERRAS